MSKWQNILDDFSKATTKIIILPVDTKKIKNLEGYITYNSNSSLAIILSNTGGIIVDNWIRIYGSGEIDFVERNKRLQQYTSMIIAEDIIGGLFAINPNGEMLYFAPDMLEWENMEIDYYSFLSWVCEKERVDLFYEIFRFDKCEEMVSNMNYAQGILHIPFLWLDDEGKDRSKNIVPIIEIQNLQFEIKQGFENKN